MRVISRDPGDDESTPFGRTMAPMRSGLKVLRTTELDDLFHCLNAVANRILAAHGGDDLAEALVDFASPKAIEQGKLIEQHERDHPRRLEVAAWLKENCRLSLIDDIAIARDIAREELWHHVDQAVAILTMPVTTQLARAGALSLRRYLYAAKRAAARLDDDALWEFDHRVSRIEATDFKTFQNAVAKAISYLAEPIGRAARIRSQRSARASYSESGEGTLVVTGPTAAIAAMDAKLEGLARAVARRQTTALGLPADAEVIDERTIQQLRFDFLLSANPAGTVKTLRTADEATKVAFEHMRSTGLDAEQAAAAIDALTEDIQLACPTDRAWLSRHAKIILTVPLLDLLLADADDGQSAASGNARSGNPARRAAARAAEATGGTKGVGLLPGTINGHPISGEEALDLIAGHDTLTRVFTHPVTGAILDAAAESYTIPESYRLLLAARWKTCTVPSCNRDAARAEIDHIVPFDHSDPAAGGQTVLENLHPVCKYHHQLKTQGRLSVERDPATGVIFWTFPGEQRIPAVPAPDPIEMRHAEEIIELIASELAGDLISATDIFPDHAPVRRRGGETVSAAGGAASDGAAADGAAPGSAAADGGAPSLFAYD